MKKYHQLLLLALSLISIFCFLFYKHQYDRLRKVLEVLDFFGPPSESYTQSNLPDMLSSTVIEESLQISSDMWQKYSDEIHFYSAIRTVNEKGWSITSIAILKKSSGATLKKLSCAVISGDTLEDKFEGTIEWKQIWNDSSISAYALICNVPEVPGRSHLLSLYEANYIHPPLNLPVNLAREPRKEPAAVTLCAISHDPVWRLSETIDYILYHAALGVESFSIYHSGTSNQVVQALREVVRTHSNLTISLMPWNTPALPSIFLDLSLVSHACANRHIAKSGLVAMVPWGHFLAIPKDGNLKSFLSRIPYQKGELSYETQLEIQLLCSNIPTKDSSLRRHNLSFKNLKSESKSAVIRWFEPQNLYSNQKVIKTDAETAKLITFEPCPLNDNEEVINDPAVQAFSKLAQRLGI